MNRMTRSLIASSALLLLVMPDSTHAQGRYGFGFGVAVGPATDGSTFLTLNGSSVLNTANRGRYIETGASGGNDNYFTGTLDGINERRGFFLFDLSNFQTSIASASISLFNCANLGGPPCNGGGNGYGSPNSSETIDLFDFLGSRTDLVGGSGGLAAFNDLGSGAVFGTRTISAADNGSTVTFVLNSAGIAALNGARGNTFAVGSAMRLGRTAVVPEPATSALLAVGLVLVGALARRRRA